MLFRSGIELYRGKPIYHGLGNYVCVTRALAVSGNDSPERKAWAERRQKLFGFAPDPLMPTYPFHPDSRHTVIARCVVNAQAEVEAGFIPCWIDGEARPVPLGRDARGEAMLDYMRVITQAAGLRVRYEWQDDWVRVLPEAPGAHA